MVKNHLQCGRLRFDPWVGKMGRAPGEGKGYPLQYSGNTGKSPWTEEPGRLQSIGSQELDTTEWLSTHQLLGTRTAPDSLPALQCLPQATGKMVSKVFGKTLESNCQGSNFWLCYFLPVILNKLFNFTMLNFLTYKMRLITKGLILQGS